MATQGLSDLETVDRPLVHQVLQDTAWQLAFRQGSPRDAELVQALFGKAWAEDVAWRSDGLLTTRLVERPRVSIDEWMNDLEPGDAWLRQAPIDRLWGQGRIRVAQPRRRSPPPVTIPRCPASRACRPWARTMALSTPRTGHLLGTVLGLITLLSACPRRPRRAAGRLTGR
jgi:hypothetical protein